MSNQPSNAASEYVRTFFSSVEAGSPSEEWLRARLTDDFTYEDRRSGPTFPDGDAESSPKYLKTIWETGVAGQPRFVHKTLAVRGERFAAVAVQIDYGNGMLFECIHVVAVDATLRLGQRGFDFDVDDVAGAIAELDRLHSQPDAS